MEKVLNPSNTPLRNTPILGIFHTWNPYIHVRMEIVALHLEDEALRRSSDDGRDQFGRSAFNRYYYATFLKVQSALRIHRPHWAKNGHSKLPRVLKDDVVKELRGNFDKGKKTGDNEIIRLCSDAISAAKALASLLEEGYATRVTADYFPDIAVDFVSTKDFKLNAITVTHAHSWPSKASGLVATLERAWRQIDA